MLQFDHEKISELRKAQDLTIEEFAKKIRTTKQTVSAWELGAVQPRLSLLVRMCNIFNVKLSFFMVTVHQSEQH